MLILPTQQNTRKCIKYEILIKFTEVNILPINILFKQNCLNYYFDLISYFVACWKQSFFFLWTMEKNPVRYCNYMRNKGEKNMFLKMEEYLWWCYSFLIDSRCNLFGFFVTFIWSNLSCMVYFHIYFNKNLPSITNSDWTSLCLSDHKKRRFPLRYRKILLMLCHVYLPSCIHSIHSNMLSNIIHLTVDRN